MTTPAIDEHVQDAIVDGTGEEVGALPGSDRDSDAPASPPGSDADGPEEAATGKKPGEKLIPNNVRKLRLERMMSKAELARRANLSVLTVDRVEKGFGCRMNTKRRILEALGLSLADRVRVFGEEE